VSYNRWEDVLLAADYKLGCASGINRYYYDAKLHPELAQTLVGHADPYSHHRKNLVDLTN
jgi:hypothetical protein